MDGIPEDLNLLDLDQYTDGVPYQWFDALRKSAPIWFHEEPGGPGFWVLSRHHDVVQASRDWRSFSSDIDNGGIQGMTESERAMCRAAQSEKILPLMDPPEHSKYRKVVIGALTPRSIAGLEPTLRAIADRFIDTIVQKGPCDFVKNASAWLPLEALAELGNVPLRDREQVFRWVNAMTSPDDLDYNPGGPAGYASSRAQILEYCRELYGLRTSAPGDDVVSLMIEGKIDGCPVTATHAAAFFELLLSAGTETTRTTLTQAMLAFIEHPEQYEDLRQNPELLQTTATEEILRWATPVLYFHRTVMQPVELTGHRFEPGEHVILSYISANRDEQVFTDPYHFDIRRNPNKHVSFGGWGPHTCPGSLFAKLQIRIFFEQWSKRVAGMRLAGPIQRLRSNLIHGIKELPVEVLM